MANLHSAMFARSTLDCAWMDPHMLCQDYELDFSMNVSSTRTALGFIETLSFQRGWFGGDYLAIVGECECR